MSLTDLHYSTHAVNEREKRAATRHAYGQKTSNPSQNKATRKDHYDLPGSCLAANIRQIEEKGIHV